MMEDTHSVEEREATHNGIPRSCNTTEERKGL
jgi:hypothetical protein